MPKLDIDVHQVANVTRDCAPAPPGTPADQIFRNLAHVVPTLSFDWGFNATAIGDHEFQLGTNSSPPATCLDYLPRTRALGQVPASSNDAMRLHHLVWAQLAALVVIAVAFCQS